MNWDTLLCRLGIIQKELENVQTIIGEIYTDWIPYGDTDGETIDQLIIVLSTITGRALSTSGDISRIATRRLEEHTAQITKEPEE